jgi:hypothetical protein
MNRIFKIQIKNIKNVKVIKCTKNDNYNCNNIYYYNNDNNNDDNDDNIRGYKKVYFLL